MTYNNKRAIHTIISDTAFNTLTKYGEGRLNTGIENLINLTNRKINYPSDLCFKCKYWNNLDKICKLIKEHPTNSEYCKMFIRN